MIVPNNPIIGEICWLGNPVITTAMLSVATSVTVMLRRIASEVACDRQSSTPCNITHTRPNAIAIMVCSSVVCTDAEVEDDDVAAVPAEGAAVGGPSIVRFPSGGGDPLPPFDAEPG
jgi:hypothetical protein